LFSNFLFHYFSARIMPRKVADRTNLYFIAIIPPSPFFEQAHQLKEYFRDIYRSKASLNSPPHITLHMPFRWKEKKEVDLIDQLSRFTIDLHAFQLRLKNFSCFSPKVIFIDVETNTELSTLKIELQRFCKTELNLFNADYKAQPFYPHITLAFRDLKKPNFDKAWDEFKEKEFHADFMVTQITLLKHTGRVWQVLHDFSLQANSLNING
jgi:2'-5' RNA ligase